MLKPAALVGGFLVNHEECPDYLTSTDSTAEMTGMPTAAQGLYRSPIDGLAAAPAKAWWFGGL